MDRQVTKSGRVLIQWPDTSLATSEERAAARLEFMRLTAGGGRYDTAATYRIFELAEHMGGTGRNDSMVWSWDIDYSDSKDTLKAGEVVSGTRRVTVTATSKVEGRLVAEQMIAAVGLEPTGARQVVIQ